MTTLLVTVLVLIVISLALDVLILAALGDLIKRLIFDAAKKDPERTRAAILRAIQEAHAQAIQRIPHYDA